MASRKDGDKGKRMAMTPLILMGVFVTFTEVIAGIATYNVSGGAQIPLIAFVCIFPFAIFGGFFWLLWARPFHLYPPPENAPPEEVAKYVKAIHESTNGGAQSAPPPTAVSVVPNPGSNPPVAVVTVVETKPVEKGGAVEKKKSADDLRWDMAIAYMDNRRDEGDKTFDVLMGMAKTPQDRDQLSMFMRYWRFSAFGNDDDLKSLIEFSNASDAKTRRIAFGYCGDSYVHIKDYPKAIVSYASAVEVADASRKSRCIVELAKAYTYDGQKDKAILLICGAIASEVLPDNKAILYAGISSIYEESGEHELRALASEKVVELHSTDSKARFSAGWAYSEAGFRSLSVLHYEGLVALKSTHNGALNNLGVAYENAELPLTAVQRYQSSFEYKNSLAGANLAYRLMNAGFGKEASAVLDAAKSMNEPHANVNSALAELAQRNEKENEKRQRILKEAGEHQRFFRRYAEALFSRSDKEPPHFDAEWGANDHEGVLLAQNGRNVKSQWRQGDIVFSLTGAAAGRTMKFEVIASSEKPVTLLNMLSSTVPKPQKGYAFINENSLEMMWLLVDESELTLRTFDRVSPPSRPALPS